MADWKSFVIEVPGKDLLEPVREVLETLLIFLEILKTILETIKAFLIDFGNPIRALVEALIKLIEELFLALKASGFFAYFDIPKPELDPSFVLQGGGFVGWEQRFKQSLFDIQDFNRPQPRIGSTQSGFILLVVDANDPFTLIRRILQLLRFFGKEFTSPRYNAPINFQAGPVGNSGDPIIDVAGVFADQPIESILLSWTLPSAAETPDPGFSDAVTKVAAEFVPPSFLIEKNVGVNPQAARIDITDFSDPDASGLVEFDRETEIDASLGGRFAETEGVRVTRREILKDKQGDPVYKFQDYILLPTGLNFLGNLGTFRFIDNDVVAGQRYFYRVRPFSGELAVSEGPTSEDRKLINPPDSVDALQKGFSGSQTTPFFLWPPATGGSEVIMGVPTGVIEVTIPEGTDFDVFENLRALFLTAFTLDFHTTLPENIIIPNQEFPDGFENLGPPTFENGAPVAPTTVDFVGKGSLSSIAGILSAFESDEVLGFLAGFATLQEASEVSNAAKASQGVPWQNPFFRLHAARFADIVMSAMLQATPAHITFRDLMLSFPGPTTVNLVDPNFDPTNPFGPSQADLLDGQNSNLSEVVFKFIELDEDDNVDATGIVRYRIGYNDLSLRQNVLVVINFLKSFSLGGIPPDWVAIVPLRDMIPWAGQFLYDLLDKIDALLAAFAGFLEEIKRFIDLLIRKIDALERFIQLIISILDFIEGLQIGAFLLSVQGISGDVTKWVEEIDNAGGDKPPSGPGGLSAGIGLAYVAPDVTAFKVAFGIIFGG